MIKRPPIVKLEIGKKYTITIKTYFNESSGVNFELYKGKRTIKKNEIEIGGIGELEGEILGILNDEDEKFNKIQNSNSLEKSKLKEINKTVYIREDGTIIKEKEIIKWA